MTNRQDVSVPAGGAHHLPAIHNSYQSNTNPYDPNYGALLVTNKNMPGYYLPKGYLKNLPILAGIPNNNNNNNNANNGFTITSRRLQQQAVLQQQQQTLPQPNLMNQSVNNKAYMAGSDYWNKPRLITIVRATERPRKKITILLNRKALHSYEQFVCDISEAFGLPQWKNDKVRKLYTLKGRKVQGISDFFRDDDIFIGVSGKEPLKASLLLDLLKEVNPDDEQAAHDMLKEWESSRSRSRTKPRNNNNNNSTEPAQPLPTNLNTSLNNESELGKSLDTNVNSTSEERYRKKSKLAFSILYHHIYFLV